jgi:NADP-dependent 3-hydroxy acid dehydrogenase YdfG
MAGNYVVLGASGGIGSETCRRLRQGGSNVLVGGRSEEPLAALAGEIDAPFRVLDATDFDH